MCWVTTHASWIQFLYWLIPQLHKQHLLLIIMEVGVFKYYHIILNPGMFVIIFFK